MKTIEQLKQELIETYKLICGDKNAEWKNIQETCDHTWGELSFKLLENERGFVSILVYRKCKKCGAMLSAFKHLDLSNLTDRSIWEKLNKIINNCDDAKSYISHKYDRIIKNPSEFNHFSELEFKIEFQSINIDRIVDQIAKI